MKKIIILVLSLFATISCSKSPQYNCTFIMDRDLFYEWGNNAASAGYRTQEIDIIFHEYSQGHRINSYKLDNIMGGTIYSFTPLSETEYLTIQIDNTWTDPFVPEVPREDGGTFYFSQVFLLNNKESISITLDSSTLFSKEEPK